MDLVHAVVVEPWVVVDVGQQHLGLDDLHVRQSRRLGHAVRDVDAEPVDAALQPEAQRLLEVLEHLGVLPVQVRLLGIEEVQVPLAGIAVCLDNPGPRGAAEDRDPVVRGVDATGAGAVTEDVALALVAAGARGQRRLKPGMRGTGVVGHQVHRHLDACGVGGVRQPVQRLDAAEQRVDIAGIRHVVAVVGHGRDHDRIEPDRVDAQRLEVIQLCGHAVEVTDAVTVAVPEGTWIDLIEQRVRPPGCRHQNGEFTIECAAISK